MSINIDGEVNIERFIDEVKIRECIWNSAAESYKDRDAKKLKWMELCLTFYPNFDEYTPKVKSELCKSLQGKWKNIKDSYRKYIKQLETKSGQARKNVKTYLYASQLSFLQSTTKLGPTESSPVCNDDVDGEEGDTNQNNNHSECSSSTMYRRRKKTFENKLESYIDNFNAHQGRIKEDDCDDLNFFKSLIPLVKPLPVSDKIKMRMEFMKLAYDYSVKNQQQSSSQSHVGTSHGASSTPINVPYVQPSPKTLFATPQPLNQPLFVEPAAGGSGVHKRRSNVSPSPMHTLQSALKRLREDEEDSSELDSPLSLQSPGGYSVGDTDNYFSEGDFV